MIFRFSLRFLILSHIVSALDAHKIVNARADFGIADSCLTFQNIAELVFIMLGVLISAIFCKSKRRSFAVSSDWLLLQKCLFIVDGQHSVFH